LFGRDARDPEGSKGREKIALLDLTHSQMLELMRSLGEPPYRVDQLYHWLYVSLAREFATMRNLSRALRERLESIADISVLTPLQEILSPDGLARKILFALSDDETIESVLMLYDRRNTVCLSTQVGCAVGCPFCATGQSGFTRNLTAGEIIDQALYFARLLREGGRSLTNVVFMGMGEPLLNYEATWQAIETLADPRGCRLGSRRFTISTAGIVPGIQRLAREKLQIRLAVSLHAPDDELRTALVPINRRYPLPELLAACGDYVRATGRRVTFEYALIDKVNDSLSQAAQLARLLDGLLCHVNLIPLNPTSEECRKASSQKRVLAFHQELDRLGVGSTIRARRGTRIEAGCGQLRSRRVSGRGAANCGFA
jgi:23S rRNA (adenine2503-C2)-methyltransferase